jgi:hypothetical protein
MVLPHYNYTTRQSNNFFITPFADFKVVAIESKNDLSAIFNTSQLLIDSFYDVKGGAFIVGRLNIFSVL